MATTPGPGIYENVPFAEYLEWPYVSNSAMGPAKKTIAHFRRALKWGDRPEEDEARGKAPAMRFGTLVHAGKLEPLSVAAKYIIRPRFEDTIRQPNGATYPKPTATNAYRDAVAEWRATIGDKEEVTEAEYQRMLGVVTALARHARAVEYLDGPGPVEVSFVWDDPHTGLRCKGRADKLQLERGRISDLKTAYDPWQFEKIIGQRAYYRQGALYVDGIEVLTGVRCEFCLVAAESTEPFGVRAAPLSQKSLRTGRREYRGLLGRIAAAEANPQWSEVSDPDEWDAPAWVLPEEQPVELTFGGRSIQL